MEGSQGTLGITRRVEESFMVGDTVKVTILQVRGDKVRIGGTAPRSVEVHRQEVYNAILQEGGSPSIS